MTEPANLRSLLRDAAARLAASDSARLDSELLMMHVLGRDRAWLYAHAEFCPTAGQTGQFNALVKRRHAGEPVAYLTGRRSFWSIDLEVNANVLIPRPETELLVELALEYLRAIPSPRLIDLGTGCGAIALALAVERPDARIVATDSSPAAIEVARSNARRLDVQNVRWFEASWFGDQQGPFDAVLSNPPYVADGDPHLERGDCRYEPRQALTPGDDGLLAIRTLSAEAVRRLKPGGLIAVEHGWDQGEAVRAILAGAACERVETARDLSGIERVTKGHQPA